MQSTFWREWKLKLEEQKFVADRSRALESIIPGVDAARFLSGDTKYMASVVHSLIESVKLEKKHVLKDILKLADTYGMNRNEVFTFVSINNSRQCRSSVSSISTDKVIHSICFLAGSSTLCKFFACF